VTGKGHIEAEINGQPRTLRLMFLTPGRRPRKDGSSFAWQSTASAGVTGISRGAAGRHAPGPAAAATRPTAIFRASSTPASRALIAHMQIFFH